MSRLTRDGTAEPVSRDQILRHARGQGNIIFPVQLTTSRIGNLTRLIHTLLYVMTIHTYIHTNRAFKHFEGARDTEVTGGIGVACMHDPRSGQEEHVDANGVVERRPSKAGRGTIWSGGYGGRAADKQYSILVTLDKAAFGGEIEYVCGVGALVRGDVIT